MLIQEPIQAAIWHALNHYAFTDAIFLAERLYAEVNSDEALFLLATSYYRSGKSMQAYTLLQSKGSPTPQCKYLLARCCIELNKLGEVENTLIENCLVKTKDLEDIVIEFGEAGCFVLSLLGRLYSKTERQNRATEAYTKSLKLNPFLWSSFEALCQLGYGPDASQVFQVNSLENFYHCQSSYPSIALRSHIGNNEYNLLSSSELQDSHLGTLGSGLTPSPICLIKSLSENNTDIISPDPINLLPVSVPFTLQSNRARPKTGRSILGGSTALTPLTPSFGMLPLGTPSPLDGNLVTYMTPSPTGYIDTQVGDPKAPAKKMISRRGQNITTTKPSVFSQSGNSSNTNISQTPSPQPNIQSVTNVRRSTRLFSNANSVKENNKGSSKTRFTSPKAPLRKPKTRSNKTNLSQTNFNEMNERNKPDTILELSISAQQQAILAQKAAAEGLMQLLQEMGKAYAALSQYDCRGAITSFSKLPLQHYKTGWVLGHLGRAHFELADYQQAVYLFSEIRNLEPYHLDGMEYFSTALWHLQKEVTLSALAQALIDMDKDAPQAWCAMGNCFSLQKEHDTAIKFFQRAAQVDPNFAYAYTLLGHEYVLTEELDKAISCFRNAIRIDSRHYNAWYGVGMIYYKQEKFQLAEVHFKKALMINPQSSVLMCHIGVVQHALQKSECALSTLNKAIAVDPTNPLCKFHRASILFANDHHQEALSELEQLKEIVPKESLVYFLTGKVHKKLGNTHLALMNFSWAMDLDPKGANNQIKEAIDKRYVNDDDDVAAQTNNSSIEELPAPERVPSQEGSGMDAEEMQLQAMESDESL